MTDSTGPDLSSALLASAQRTRVVDEVAMVLDIGRAKAEEIVDAFDRFVAEPLAANLAKLRGRDLAKRNPMIYTVRGITDVAVWIDRVLADKETSAIEGLLGTWQEEVARIVSGGVKPGSGVDLQVEGDGQSVRLYAIQSSPNTKNAGGRKADVDALKKAAKVLFAAKRQPEMFIAVLNGRNTTAEVTNESITVLASDAFWESVSGIADFRARLLSASTKLAALIRAEAADEIARIRREARAIFGDGETLDVDALANPSKAKRVATQAELDLEV